MEIHFDLDVHDSSLFRSLPFANPNIPNSGGAPSGQMQIAQVIRLLYDVSEHVQIV